MMIAHYNNVTFKKKQHINMEIYIFWWVLKKNLMEFPKIREENWY